MYAFDVRISSAVDVDGAAPPQPEEKKDGPLAPDLLEKMQRYWQAANYLTVGQIYLQANPLLRYPLRPEHIKPRLLGHWGTSPGLNMLYVHLNRLIKEHDVNAIYLTGPGHQTGLLVQSYFFGISWVLFAVFLAGVVRALRGAYVWSSLVVISGAVWVALNMGSQAITAALTARIAQKFAGGAALVGLHDVTVMLFGLSFFGIVGVVLGASLGAAETAVFGRWYGWYGYAVTVVALVTALSIIWPSSSFLFAMLIIGFLLFVIWIVWSSVVLLRTPDAVPAESISLGRPAEVGV